MVRVYLDEDVDVLLCPLLAGHRHTCTSASDVGHLGWTDEAQLEYATNDNRVLITHNRVDFEKLAVAWYGSNRPHAGVVLAFRRADTYDLVRHVLPVLGLYEQGGWRNMVLYA